MNPHRENLFQDELYLLDFMDASVNWTKLNLEYISVYIDTYFSTSQDVLKLGQWDTFYDRWLSNIDRELECELGSRQFTSNLKDWMKSTIKLRSTYRTLGFPIEHYDELLYSIKKFMMSLYVFPLMQEFGYSTPSEVVYTLGKVTLRHYKNSQSKLTAVGLPVLIVYAQINRFNILDISSDRSVVRNLTSNGLDVYVLDWGYSGSQDDNRSVEDYVKILHSVMDIITSRHKKNDKISILGYCWGGLISIIFTALHPDRVNALALLASPVDSSKDNSLLAVWARSIDADMIIQEFGHMDGQILDLAFIMRNPPRNLCDKYLKLFKNFNDKHFVNSFLAVENWLFRTPPIPGVLYRQIINDLYKRNLLIRNDIKINGKAVDLKKIDVPLLNIVAENDDLVSPASSLAVNEYVSSVDKKSIKIPGGHVGLLISKRAHEKLWPEVADWILLSRTRRK